MEASLGGLSAAKIVQSPTEQNSATNIKVRFVIVPIITSQFVSQKPKLAYEN